MSKGFCGFSFPVGNGFKWLFEWLWLPTPALGQRLGKKKGVVNYAQVPGKKETKYTVDYIVVSE